MGFVALTVIGKLGPAVDGATPQYEAADLIEMVDAPELIEAPRVIRPGEEASLETTGVDPDVEPNPNPNPNPDGIEDGTAVAGPSASLDGENTEIASPLSADTQTPLAAAPGVSSEAPSETPTEVVEPSDPRSRGEAALATISYPWEQLLPGWTIDFLPEKSGLFGLTLVPDKRIEVYVRDNQTEALLAHVIAHELGHAIDVTLNDGPDRRAWAEARGTGSSPWWPGNGTTDFSTGAGDFAESFAAWQVGSGSFRSTLAGPPTDAQIELLAQLAAG